MKQDLAKNNPYMKMMVNILRAGKIIDHKVSDVLKEFGVTHIQFNILRVLESRKPDKLSLSEIQHALLYETSDVSRLVDRLVRQGLVSRTINPANRRQLELSITKKGFDLIGKALPKIEKSMRGYYRNEFSEAERDQLIEMMKRIK